MQGPVQLGDWGPVQLTSDFASELLSRAKERGDAVVLQMLQAALAIREVALMAPLLHEYVTRSSRAHPRPVFRSPAPYLSNAFLLPMRDQRSRHPRGALCTRACRWSSRSRGNVHATESPRGTSHTVACTLSRCTTSRR